LGKSSTWFNSHIDITCSLLPSHTQKVISFSVVDMAAKNPSKLVFSRQFMARFSNPHYTQKMNTFRFSFVLFFNFTF
jgi:hypothetical protein